MFFYSQSQTVIHKTCLNVLVLLNTQSWLSSLEVMQVINDMGVWVCTICVSMMIGNQYVLDRSTMFTGRSVGQDEFALKMA